MLPEVYPDDAFSDPRQNRERVPVEIAVEDGARGEKCLKVAKFAKFAERFENLCDYIQWKYFGSENRHFWLLVRRWRGETKKTNPVKGD